MCFLRMRSNKDQKYIYFEKLPVVMMASFQENQLQPFSLARCHQQLQPD